MKFMLDPEKCRINDERLAALKDRHYGKRAVIIGNGPSLKMEDLGRLKNEITFASNRIYLAFDQTDWRPTYYSICDAVVGKENHGIVKDLPVHKILAGSVREFYQDDPDAIFVNFPRSEDEKNTWVDDKGVVRMQGAVPPKEPFLRKMARWMGLQPAVSAKADVEALKNDINWPVSWNLLRGARAGHSVVNLALKIAYWMGIREVYVIGCDHNFVVPDTKTGEVVYHNEVILSEGEVNHFHPEYRKPGEKWTVPQLDTMAQEFAYARWVYETDGRSIKNASRRTKLEVWDRVDFDSVF